MNKTNLDLLISNYIENFDFINNEANAEYYKWEAVKHFQDNWDIDAPDFAAMFKEAVKESYNLINNRIVQPTNGIVKLAEIPELTETVRQMFRDLLADDGGDIDKRQDKIHAFLEKADELLDAHFKGSWKYAQDMRAVIFYLSFLEPEKNYMFKATQAREFMYCIEYGNDFGSGDTFSLKKYYEMCDELVAAIKDTPELVELHQNRLTDTMWEHDDYHILAYDIIYSAIVYNLYNNISIVKPSRGQSNTHSHEQAIRERKEALNSQLDTISARLNELLQQRASFDDFSAKGLKVSHKMYGAGVVVTHNGNSLSIQFGNQVKKFQMPQGFSNGYLKTESLEMMEMFTEIGRIEAEIEKVKQQQSSIQRRLSSL